LTSVFRATRPLHRTLALVAFLFLIQPAHAVDVDKYPDLVSLIQTLHQKYDYSEEVLRKLFSRVEIRPRVIRRTKHPGERRPWYAYRDQFVTGLQARRGSRFWHAHADALRRAHARFGVDPAILVSIIGIESRFGHNTGHFRVLDTLTTQMLHHPRRKDFFTRELTEFLLLIRKNRLQPLAVRGSYAGAIGVAQFLPSTYLNYAVDFDGDGRSDLMNSMPDAIGSIANFIRRNGWKPDQPVCDETRVHGQMAPWLSDLGTKPLLSLEQFANFGITPATDGLDPNLRADLIQLEGRRGMEHRLVFNNFFVIRRYNHNDKYAMAVCDLSRMIRHHYAARSPS
jgi:membrane-bound lytic murein transglycosylase B